MTKCVYCKAENRDEAIFCIRCRRPLQRAPRPPRIAFVWVLMAVAVLGVGSYLVAFRSPFSPVTTFSVTPPVEQSPIPVCVSDTISIQRGPGTTYETIGGMVTGTCLRVLGRNEEATWVYMVSEDHQAGWVAASVLGDVGDLTRVSVRDHSALANSTRPTLTSAEVAHGAALYLTNVAAPNGPEPSRRQYVVPCFEAAERLGDQVSCRMERAHCDFLPDLEGSPTVCNDRPAPDHVFAMIADNRDWRKYDGKCLIVTGYLELHGGVLQIHVRNDDQVSTCE